LLEKETTHRGITIKSKATGMISAVKRKAVSQGHGTLGFHFCGDGTSRAHKKIMKKAIKYGEAIVKLLTLPHPPVRARTDARTNPSTHRATQLRSVLARVYAVSRQNQTTTTFT
jgi:hypothetical protein